VLAYYVVAKGLQVLLGFSAGVVTVALSPDQYFGFLIALLLIFGVSFELPLLVVMLNQVGVLPAANLRRWNRGIIFGFFVFAAFVIPGGDAVSMTILAIALTVLFEGALLVAIAMAHDKKHGRLVATQGLEGLDDDEASPLNLDTAPVDAAHPIEEPPHYTDAT